MSTRMHEHDLAIHPHRRKNILTGEWVLVSPQRTRRPWQGETAAPEKERRPVYDPKCYLCPGNKRANGDVNPRYKDTYVFTNDFSSLLPETPSIAHHDGLLHARTEKGICRVVNFSPRHDLTLAEMSKQKIEKVIDIWQKEFKSLAANPRINHVQIFENKGAMMGNSNPHPHGQIWAQSSIPRESEKELLQFRRHFSKTKRSLLSDYVKQEMSLGVRVVHVNDSFVTLVPYWAVWPYETMIVPKRKMATILQFSKKEKRDFSDSIRAITVKYDNLFTTSFPYSAGLHQAPTDGRAYDEWHLHMHFYPPLLRSAAVKKFMVGYEMLAEPQRDITPEQAAAVLKKISTVHYRKRSRR
ncbi:MAG TPA: UDP-glucose--hexose-1-phosphate uridylyltransferase [Bacteroidota bacterium]|nr:UDP-glucose--hexose-1-phosphate uridylyltransferase [Bacteroidota bacterium]